MRLLHSIDLLLVLSASLVVVCLRHSEFRFFGPPWVTIVLGCLCLVQRAFLRQRDFQKSPYPYTGLRSGDNSARTLLIWLISLHASLALLQDSRALGLQGILFLILIFVLLLVDFGLLLRIHLLHFSLAALLHSLGAALRSLLWVLPTLGATIACLQHWVHSNRPGDSQTSLTGWSLDLHPGSIAKLILRPGVAYRVEISAQPGPIEADHFFLEKRYWRFAVLSESQGLSWRGAKFLNRFPGIHPGLNFLPATCRLIQHVYPSRELANEWTTEMAAESAHRSIQLPGEIPSIALDPLVGVIQDQQVPYEVFSECQGEAPRPEKLAQPLSAAEQVQYLQVPKTISIKVRTWVQQLRVKGKRPLGVKQSQADFNRSFVQKILLFFRSDFWYSLHPKRLGRGDSDLDAFLFETREGFCEHYAGALATLLRIAGIPSRVVVGFRGSIFNPYQGGYWSVRYQNAHSWVEFWDGLTWVSIDPTRSLSLVRTDDLSAPTVSAFQDQLERLADAFLFQAEKFKIRVSTLNFWILGAMILIGMTGGIVWVGVNYTNRFKSKAQGLRVQTEFQEEFMNLCSLLHERILLRRPHEGYESYRIRLLGEFEKRNLDEGPVNSLFLVYEMNRYGQVPIGDLEGREQIKKIKKVRKDLLQAQLE